MEYSKLEYNASEHDDLFSIPLVENDAEQWLSNEFVMLQSTRPQALCEDP
ncbi:hypothetical protein PENSTE_c041G07433 [Penicillium steckii]|uniref:Uncharacterized protein n=1 Tax=Penicillium steckii TaxID=303698 RepID=A0A1V6SIS7_9EURO|nr:hypothetical protein PENSTE_c041G07433 [Penicillium steckii]